MLKFYNERAPGYKAMYMYVLRAYKTSATCSNHKFSAGHAC